MFPIHFPLQSWMALFALSCARCLECTERAAARAGQLNSHHLKDKFSKTSLSRFFPLEKMVSSNLESRGCAEFNFQESRKVQNCAVRIAGLGVGVCSSSMRTLLHWLFPNTTSQCLRMKLLFLITTWINLLNTIYVGPWNFTAI